MVNFPSWIPDCDSHSAALLDFCYSSYTSVCSEMAFYHWEMLIMFFFSISIDFPSNSQQDAPFHLIAYDYSRVYSVGLCDHLKDVTW